MTEVLAAGATCLLVLHYLTVGRVRGLAALDSVFVVMQWIMTVGTLVLLTTEDPLDRQYAWIMTVPFAIYTLMSIMLFTTSSPRGQGRKPPQMRIVRVAPTHHPVLLLVLVLSLVVTVVYYLAVGYNVFALGVQQLFSGSPAGDFTEMRRQSYSSDRYLAPGYANQFKNTLLPAAAVVVLHNALSQRRPGRVPTAVGLGVVILLALLGTGQRGAFILFLLSVGIFIYHLDRKKFARRAMLGVAVAAPPLFLSTLLLGRSTADLAGTSGLGSLKVLAQELWARFFEVNQLSGRFAYDYTSYRATQWGREWVDGVLGILPGHSGSSLARDVFNMLYGTDQGTAPASLWGSVHYNFEWFGLILLPIVLAVAFHKITNRHVYRESINTVELMGASGFAAVTGSWVAGGPDYLTNAGSVAFAALWFIGSRIARRQANQAEVPTSQEQPPASASGRPYQRSRPRSRQIGPRSAPVPTVPRRL